MTADESSKLCCLSIQRKIISKCISVNRKTRRIEGKTIKNRPLYTIYMLPWVTTALGNILFGVHQHCTSLINPGTQHLY